MSSTEVRDELLAAPLPVDDDALIAGSQPLSPEVAERADRVERALRKRAAHWGVVLFLGGGVAVAALTIGESPALLPWVITLVAGIFALGLLISQFELSLILFISVCWIAIGTPQIAQGGSGGGAQRLLLSHVGLLALIAVWIARSPFVRGGLRLSRTPMNAPILLYLAICTWSTINGLLFPDWHVVRFGPKLFWQVNVLELLTRYLTLVGMVMIGSALRSARMIRIAAVALIIPGLVTFSGVIHGIPTSFYLAFPQIVAMSLLAAFALTASWVSGRRGLCLRAVAGGFAAAIFIRYFFLGTDWVSGWSGAGIALLVIGWNVDRRLVFAGAAVITVIIAFNFSYFYKTVYTDNFYAGRTAGDASRAGQTGQFTNDRSRMLMAAVRYADTFPLGIGLGNYRAYNAYFGRTDVWNTTTFTSAHGTYAQALSETGWAGLITLLALLSSCVRFLNRTYRTLAPGWGRTFALGALGAAVGIFASAFLGDYLFPAYHNGGMGSFGACVYVWFLIGVSIAVAREFGLVAATEPAPVRDVGPVYGHGPHAAGAGMLERTQ
jgi:hypothetical protein